MATYVKRVCPKCNYILESYRRNYIAVAPPFTECPRCGTSVRLNHCNEWDLMPLGQKIAHVAVTVFTGILYAMVPIVVMIFLNFDPSFLSWVTENSEVRVLVLGLLLGEICVFYLLRKRIQESDERLADSEYRDKLRRLGLIK